MRRRARPRPSSGTRRVSRAAVLSVLLLPGPAARALEPAKALSQYVHESWGVEQGLPQVTARAIVQGPDGYLWFGTQEGLVRFDGVRFAVHDLGSTPALGGNGINSLGFGPDGTLWIGRDRGLSRLRGGVMEAVPLDGAPVRSYEGGIERGDVNVVLAEESGDVWLAVPGRLLLVRDGGVRAVPVPPGLANAPVRCLLRDRGGTLRVGTTDGLWSRTGESWTRHTVADGLPDASVGALCSAGDGSLWIGTTRGLARLRDGALTRVLEPSALPYPGITALLEDRDGSLWIGTDPGGLSRLRGGTLTSLPVAGGGPEGTIVSLLEDREGSLWVGSATGGLHRFRDGTFTPFGTPEGLSADMTTGLWEDDDGVLWIGTPGSGVDRLAGGRVSAVTTRDGLPASDVSALAGSRDGGLIVGTISGGLARIRDGKVSTVSLGDGGGRDAVRSLHVDRSGDVWVGGNHGLTRLRDGAATRLTARDGLLNRTVLSLAEGPDGTIWIGTASGLNRLRDGRIDVPPGARALFGASCFSLHADEEGTVWVGTLTAGLHRLRGGTLATAAPADGLYNGTVFRILDDRRGNLWLSCNKGVFRVRRDEIERLAAGRIDRISSVAYGVLDGMRSPECNRGGGIRTRDGRLWFSTVRGLVSVDPARLRSNPLPPPVLLEEVRADGRTALVPGRASVRLPAGTGSVEIRYTATSLLVPERVRFRYLLEGYDGDWTEAGTRRSAFYSRLPPGTYSFRVRACNDDGVWNEEGARLSLTVEPHPWQTWWFLVLEVLAGSALVGAVLVAQRRRFERRRLEELRLADLARKTSELEYARRVQLDLLPKGPWRAGPFEVAGETRTATEVGGDYFGYFPSGAGRFVVVIGDATGHGVAAGLVVGMAKAVLASLRLGSQEGGPADWLQALNGALRASIAQRGLGMCVGLALVEEETGRVLLSVAGVPHAFVCRAGSRSVERIERTGPPLGYLARIELPTVERLLGPGDRLVLFTDGLLEQRDRGGRMWDYGGIAGALEGLCAEGLPPLETARGLLDACERFASGAPRDDDQTVVVLARGGRERVGAGR